MQFAEFTTSKPAGLRGLLWNLLLLVWGGALLVAITHGGAPSTAPVLDQTAAQVFDSRERVQIEPPADASAVLSQFYGDQSLGAEVQLPPPEPASAPETVETEALAKRVLVGRQSAQTQVKPELTAEEAGELYVRLRDEEATASAWQLRTWRRYSGYVHEDRVRPTPEWLKDHQNREGYWSADGYRDDSARDAIHNNYGLAEKDGLCSSTEDDVAVTALSLLVFVGAGYDHKEGDYRATCRQAILWLRGITNDDGSIDGVYSIRTYAWVAMAWSECYGLSGDAVLKPHAERALKYILDHRYAGSGWGADDRYSPDLNSTAIAVLALKSAKMVGLEFDTERPYGDVKRFLDSVAYDAQSIDRQPLDAACWIMASLFIGHADLNDERIKERAALLAREENLPKWEAGRIDFEYWWFASLALYQVGGEPWKKWEKTVSATLSENQRGYSEADKKQGWTNKELIDDHGSWDPVDPWNKQGRVFSTTVAGLTLEVYYRYLRLKEAGK